MEIILVLAELVCAYFGYKWAKGFVEGRWPALEQEGMAPLKKAVTLAIGLLVGGFVLVMKILKVVFHLMDE